MNGDGTGAATVYDSPTIPAEKNSLKFIEPYLLAASANPQGKVGSQFIVTLDSLPPLDGSDHTIFGRLVSGRETLNMIEGVDEFKKLKSLVDPQADKKPAKVYVKNAGVYKFEQTAGALRRTSAAGVYDFKPSDFYETRRQK